MEATTSILKLFCLALTLLFIVGCDSKPVSEKRIPGIVHGASMAPTLFGEHFSLECADCGLPIRFAVGTDPLPAQMVCPNCGFKNIDLKLAEPLPVQRVWIDPDKPIQRWDVVAFRLPGSNSVGIKRIVGLPNEVIEIQNGKLTKEGVVLSKPLEVQKQLRIPVYDSAFCPKSIDPAARWQTKSEYTRWAVEDGQLVFDARLDIDREPRSENDRGTPLPVLDWIRFLNWRCCPHSGKRDDVFPVEDIDFYNPSTSRKLNPTADLFVEIEGNFPKEGIFGFRLFRGESVIEIVCECKGNQEVDVTWYARHGSDDDLPETDLARLTPSSHQPHSFKAHRWPMERIELSLFDHQLKIHFDGQAVCHSEPIPEPQRFTDHVFEIGASSHSMNIRRVQIWRDIYYLEQSGKLEAGPESRILLGDNPPLSTDSRFWNPPDIHKQDILGVVQW